jgi:hypothetical protein
MGRCSSASVHALFTTGTRRQPMLSASERLAASVKAADRSCSSSWQPPSAPFWQRPSPEWQPSCVLPGMQTPALAAGGPKIQGEGGQARVGCPPGPSPRPCGRPWLRSIRKVMDAKFDCRRSDQFPELELYDSHVPGQISCMSAQQLKVLLKSKFFQRSPLCGHD